MKSITLTLPYPISANRYWRHVNLPYGGFRVVKSKEAQWYRKACHVSWLQAKQKPFEGAIGVSLKLYPRDKRSIDLDNGMKVPFDALQGLAYRNDRQIRRICAEYCEPDKANPRLEITLEEIYE